MGFFRRQGSAFRRVARRMSRGVRNTVTRAVGKTKGSIRKTVKTAVKTKAPDGILSKGAQTAIVKQVTDDAWLKIKPKIPPDPTGEVEEAVKAGIHREVVKQVNSLVNPSPALSLLQVALLLTMPIAVFGVILAVNSLIVTGIPPGNILFPQVLTDPFSGAPLPPEPMVNLTQGLFNGALYGGSTAGLEALVFFLIR